MVGTRTSGAVMAGLKGLSAACDGLLFEEVEVMGTRLLRRIFSSPSHPSVPSSRRDKRPLHPLPLYSSKGYPALGRLAFLG